MCVCIAPQKKPVIKMMSSTLAAAELCSVVSFENVSPVSWPLKWKSIMLAWAAENMETIDHVPCTVN